MQRINGDVSYGELDVGWTAKNAFDGDVDTDDNWRIIGGALTQVGINGGYTRASQVFTTDLTDSGWSLDFDLANESLDQIQLFAGLDVGNNKSRYDVYSNGNDVPPQDDIVVGTWTTLLDETALSAGFHSITIDQNLGSFDIMVLKFRGINTTVGLTIDNLAFSQIPEPGSIWLFSIAGAFALAFHLAFALHRRTQR